MTPGQIAFWILAVMAVGSAAGVVLRRNPIHSALFLVAHLATVAGGVEAVGRLLFTDYLFPFEVTSVLLLVALVGVIALAKRRTA